MAEIVSVVASTHNPRIFWNRDQASPEDMNELYATFNDVANLLADRPGRCPGGSTLTGSRRPGSPRIGHFQHRGGSGPALGDHPGGQARHRVTAALGRQLLAGPAGSACPSRPVLAAFPGAAEGLPDRGEAAGVRRGPPGAVPGARRDRLAEPAAQDPVGWAVTPGSARGGSGSPSRRARTGA